MLDRRGWKDLVEAEYRNNRGGAWTKTGCSGKSCTFVCESVLGPVCLTVRVYVFRNLCVEESHIYKVIIRILFFKLSNITPYFCLSPPGQKDTCSAP